MVCLINKVGDCLVADGLLVDNIKESDLHVQLKKHKINNITCLNLVEINGVHTLKGLFGWVHNFLLCNPFLSTFSNVETET